uniref:Reverse transcriptase domain-containing protein n=1 Tax=Tanacetum cinerariifolium TaxID=118510 RepID=A0A6L2LNB7_TANCI|nr:reverse transcriptase domain-containing protein [Tanacetum cinerariifolium]
MSAMANTTPIVTTVTKPATNPRDTDATPRVNNQDFYEEYYEDILPIIMDKVHRDKRKEVHARLDFREGSREKRTREIPTTQVIEGRVHSTDLAKPTRRAQPSLNQSGQTPGIILVVEAIPAGWTLQMKIVLRIENASVTLESQLTKRLNEHVPKIMEEMMITTTTFIRGEAVAASKKKGHTSWRAHDQSKRQTSEKILTSESQGGIVTIRSTILILADCITVITSSAVPKEVGSCLENFKVAIHPDVPDQEVAIKGMLSAKGRTELCSILKKNLDIFAWRPSDMTGGPGPERAKAIQAEIQKLVEEGIMREVYYQDWLSNPVMVKKHDDSLWMCVDFSDLNKACPQDCYPFQEIDWKVESLYGYPFKCFLDAYKGYHQIKLADPDEEKTVFHTDQGVYCYTKMPFGLKNVGATYQRLVDKAFDSQTGQNIEVYVDDLVVKSHTEAEMLRDIDEMFRMLRKINMKLNLKKCTFGAAEGVFLVYVEKSLPLFKTLKMCIKKSDFNWTAKAKQAFKQRKQDLSELPLLIAPKPKEELIVYLSATYEAISAVLMTERGATQTPIYFINRILHVPELNYTLMEKLVMPLVFIAKRLQRTSLKGQILADFLIEMPDENPPAAPVAETQQEPWTLFTDGSSCVDRSGAGLILTSPEGTEFTYTLRFQFAASNNEAEYEALIAGLRIAAQMGVKNVHVSIYSKLVANQVLGTYVAKEKIMIKYLEKVKSLVSGFTNFSISQVPRSKKKADALSKIASTSFAHLSKQVLVEILKRKIHKREGGDNRGRGRRTDVDDINNGVIERKDSFQAEYVIREIHEGSCSMHAGPWSVVGKAIRLGYYWSTMHRDACVMIRTCNDYQIHRPITRNPQQPLTPITALLLFYKWGIDIAGPFSEGPGKVKFLIVAMDYFTKWIKAKAVATITGSQMKKFVWDNIVCRFGLPREIVSDNGIKACLGEGNKNWVEELPHVFWAHRTMIKSSHDDTPFSLTYGTEAVIPAEIRMPTYRTATVDVVYNDEELRLNLDLLKERRKRTTIREAKANLKMTKYYNARVRGVLSTVVITLVMLWKEGS